jgi:hypothetical protein|tara:strand:+ start:518 stop:958 length:441 start_codon:yes stop_codon:yes gene_type:complete
MAFAITLNNGVHKIASNETEKNEINIFFPPAVAHTISDDEFNKIKKNTAVLNFVNNTISVVDFDINQSFADADALKRYHATIKPLINDFLEPSTGNDTKSLHNSIQSYSNTLESFDYSSITYPLDKSWEQYCEENSITYVHPLQIP